MDCDGTGRVFLHLFVTDMLHYRQDKANAVFELAARVGKMSPSRLLRIPREKVLLAAEYYTPRTFFIFSVFNDLDFVSVHKNARKR